MHNCIITLHTFAGNTVVLAKDCDSLATTVVTTTTTRDWWFPFKPSCAITPVHGVLALSKLNLAYNDINNHQQSYSSP